MDTCTVRTINLPNSIATQVAAATKRSLVIIYSNSTVGTVRVSERRDDSGNIGALLPPNMFPIEFQLAPGATLWAFTPNDGQSVSVWVSELSDVNETPQSVLAPNIPILRRR